MGFITGVRENGKTKVYNNGKRVDTSFQHSTLTPEQLKTLDEVKKSLKKDLGRS